MTRAAHSAELVEAAYTYLGLGLKIIALAGKAPNGKVHKRGLYDAFVGLPVNELGVRRAIEAAFQHPQTTGIGALTCCPYYVIDIDGPEGAVQWKEIAGEDFIPDRWVARTGRRDEYGNPTGLHLWVADFYEWPTAKLGPKLDFKGAGGYVVMPPSVHPDTGERYEWLSAPDEDIPLELPVGLHDLLVRRADEAAARMVNKRAMKLSAPEALHDGKLYPVATFDGIIKRVKDEPEGNRNGVLYWAARTMIEEGADEEDIEELLDAATASGLTRRESRRTVRSAIEATGG